MEKKRWFFRWVSCNEKPWYEIINEFANENFKMNEEELYLDIYKKYYPNGENILCPIIGCQNGLI